MPYPGHDLKFPIRTPAEERLCDWTAVFNCQGRPNAYFAESLASLRAMPNRHKEVIDKLKLYLQHAKGDLLLCKISAEIEQRETLLRSVEKKELKPRRRRQSEARFNLTALGAIATRIVERIWK
jgi:hypothetical protein